MARRSLSFVPPPLALGGTVGSSGSRIAGPEAKAGSQPSETAGPRVPGPTQEPTSYFPEQMETPDTLFLPFLLSPPNACLLLVKAPALTLSPSPRYLPGLSPATDLPFPALRSPLPFPVLQLP